MTNILTYIVVFVYDNKTNLLLINYFNNSITIIVFRYRKCLYIYTMYRGLMPTFRSCFRYPFSGRDQNVSVKPLYIEYI